MSNLSPLVSPLAVTHTPWAGSITPQGRPELRLGSADPDPADGPVRYLQRLLCDRGYDYVLVNGQFDLLTLTAVKDFQLRYTSPLSTAENGGEGIVGDPLWDALLAPAAATVLSPEPEVAPCPLGTHRSRLDQTMPPDLAIAGRSSPPQRLQYAHFSPNSAAWRNYLFRDDQGQLPQLQLGDTDPQGSTDGPIRQLQAFLQDHGYYKGAIDGRFSQELHDVVVTYQNTHPSLLADGVINAADWEQLFRDDRLDVPVAEPVPNALAPAAMGRLVSGEDPTAIAPLPANLPLISFDSLELAVPGVAPTTHRPWLRLHAADDDTDPNGPIRQLQRLLFVVGLGVPLTGVFDMATEQAVQQFQAQFPDRADPLGEVGPDTWARLEQAAQQPLDPFALLVAPDVGVGSATLPAVPDPRWYWDEALPLSASGSLETRRLKARSAEALGGDLSPFPPTEIIDLSTPLPLTLPEVQKGQTDATVNGPIAHLQQLLNEYGYVLTVDGQFNEATYQAVLNFQHSHDLPPTGVVDRPTWEVLMGGDTTDPAPIAALGNTTPGSSPMPAPAPTYPDTGSTGPTADRMPSDLAIATPSPANQMPSDLAIVDLTGSELGIPAQGNPDLTIPDQVMADLTGLMGLTDLTDLTDLTVAAQESPLPMTETTPPAWAALMGQGPDLGQGPDQGQEPLEPTPLLAVTPPLDLSLPPELLELPIAPPDLGEGPAQFAPDGVPRVPRPDPLMPSATKPLPMPTLVDIYAQGEAALNASQQQALQWLSQQLPTATLTEFQQRWQSQGSGT